MNLNKAISYYKLKGFNESEAINIYFRSMKMNKRGWEYMVKCNLVNDIKTLLDLKEGDRRLGFILYWLFRAYKTGTWLRISRKKAYYTAIPNGMTYDFFIGKVIDPLIEMGYLQYLEGCDIAGVESRVKPTEALTELFERYDQIELEEEIITLDKSTPIIVKNTNKKEIKFSSSNREARRMIRNIALINAAIKRSYISIHQEGIDLIKKEIQTELKRIQDRIHHTPPLSITITGTLGEEEVKNLQYLCGLETKLDMSLLGSEKGGISGMFYYYRIFNQRTQNKGTQQSLFDLGGRFYCAASNLPSKSLPVRDYILIDGEETVELDYSALHPTIIAITEGVHNFKDPYSFISDVCPDWSRSDHKKAINALINCSTAKQANSYLKGVGVGKPSAYIKEVIANTPWIKEYIATDAGVVLQNIDSCLAEEVMIEFINATNSPILCWHDSFRVKKSHEAILKSIMADVFQKRFNSSIQIK